MEWNHLEKIECVVLDKFPLSHPSKTRHLSKSIYKRLRLFRLYKAVTHPKHGQQLHRDVRRL